MPDRPKAQFMSALPGRSSNWPRLLLTHFLLWTLLKGFTFVHILALPPVAVDGLASRAATFGLVAWGLLFYTLPLLALGSLSAGPTRLWGGLARAGLLFLSLYIWLDCACLLLASIPLSYFIGFIPELIQARGQALTAVGGGSLALPVTGFLLGWALLSALLWRVSRAPLGLKPALATLSATAVLACLGQLGWSNPNQELNAHLRLGVDRGYLGSAGYRLRRWLRPAGPHLYGFSPLPGNKQGSVSVEQARTGLEVGFPGLPPAPVEVGPDGKGQAVCSLPADIKAWTDLSLREVAGKRLERRAVTPETSYHFTGSRFSPETVAAFRPITPLVERYWQRQRQHRDTAVLEPAALAPQPPHILVIVVESLRRDALNPDMMPELWQLKQRGLVFQQHLASTNSSHLALFAILAGRSPIVYFWAVKEGLRPYLPAQLKAFGYRTGYWGSTPKMGWKALEAFIHPSVFDVIAAPKELMTNFWEVPARDAFIAQGLPKVLREARQPQFIFVWFSASHFPYGYPKEYELAKPTGDGVVTFENIFRLDRKIIVNRYYNSVRFLDHQLAQVLRQVDLNKTVVLITGDHGESLGEFGQYSHGTNASDAQVLVPCLLFGKGVQPGDFTQPSCHLDLAATLVNLICRPGRAPATLEEGRDLLRPDLPERILTLAPFQTASPYPLIFQWRGLRLLTHLECFDFGERADLGPNRSEDVRVRTIAPLGPDGAADFGRMPDAAQWPEFYQLLERL